MLQKKRDQFRKQIRRTHLQNYMAQRRKQFQNTFSNQTLNVLKQIDAFFQSLQNILLNMTQQKKKKHKFNNSILDLQNNNINFQNKPHFISEEVNSDKTANFSLIVAMFHKFKSSSPKEYQKIFTKYMMNKNSAMKLTNILCDLIKNEEESQEQDEDQPVQGISKKYSSVVRNFTVYELIKFLDTLQYFAMGQIDTVFMIIDTIWQLLTDDILFNQNEDFGMLKYVLSILSKLMQDQKHQQVFRYFKKKGIGSQIIKLIQKVYKIKIPLQIHLGLLKLLENYLSCQITVGPPQPDKIGGVTITTFNVNQKEVFLAYCIAVIDKKQEYLYSTVFSCLIKLFQLHQFLAGNIKHQYLILISDLILHENRQIQTESLSLLNELTFHSQQNLDFLLKNDYLFDTLYKRLMLEKSFSDENTTKNIQRIAYIICNSLLTQKKILKTSCLHHYIWQQIDSSFHPSNKLFPLIMTMPYFLQANGHKNFDKYFRPYLQALQSFEWTNCAYRKGIQDSITRVFYNAYNQWQQHQYQLLLRILNELGFLYLVQDSVDPSDLQKLNQIQIQ